ncbi:MAG: DUF885 domain-containing protein [Gammaproteobacteria bacterium]|nr:DUF885 domain-containing protein [Gammaproteobacteria bacterium]|tara:strand:- start:1358 stop:3196 length:1839 start_codon:yes stop_codon:yes gene_type:complete
MIKYLKRVLKFFKYLFLIIFIPATIYLSNLFLMKPYSIDHYLGKELVMGLVDSPEALTYIGIFDDFNWLTRHNSRLSIPADGDLENDIKEIEKGIKTLYKYKDSSLSDIQKSTKAIAIFDLENNLRELQEFPYLDYPLNQIGGIHLNTIQFMNDMHPIRKKSEAVDFIKRADLVKKVYEGTLKDLEKQAENRIYPPEFVYGHVIKQLQEFIDYEFNDHPLYTQFMMKVNKLNLSESDNNYLDSEIKRAIKESVTPGFELLLKFMLKTEKFANKNHGIWSQPGGDEYYKLRIRSYTTTDYSPEEIHQMGLSEVKRITDRMNEILTGLGYDTSSKSVGQIMNELNENPDFLYADTPDRKEIVIRDYTDMTNEAIEVMTDYFHTMPKSEVIVKAVPEYSEKTAAGGYYQSPALDGSRPGVFYANLYDIKQTPKYSMRTLTYHEATPGHHHQIAHSLENEDLTLYRRFGYGTSAFSEGWALYAERLALEVGLANDPYDELGILQSEIFRAVRLVVDTGMHYKRWTREEAMEYMKSKTGMSDTEVRVEIERYIVWPGQALSYKVGMIKILELREKAMNELGDDFNLKDFHSAVLDHGNPPLFIVEEMVNKMIEDAKS